LKNFLLTATFSITILTLFLAPSATNLAFADTQCESDCNLAAGIEFDDCIIETTSQQFPNGDINFCNFIAGQFFDSCVELCPPPPPTGCTTDDDCQDGLFCNGREICIAFIGQCVPGAPIVCDDTKACTADSCNEITNNCEFIDEPNGTECGTNDQCETNVCEVGQCNRAVTFCDDLDVCTINTCDPDLGCQTAPNPVPVCAKVGGVIVPLENTSLLVAGAQSFSWMIPVVLSVLGIGLFVVSRKSE